MATSLEEGGDHQFGVAMDVEEEITYHIIMARHQVVARVKGI